MGGGEENSGLKNWKGEKRIERIDIGASSEVSLFREGVKEDEEDRREGAGVPKSETARNCFLIAAGIVGKDVSGRISPPSPRN